MNDLQHAIFAHDRFEFLERLRFGRRLRQGEFAIDADVCGHGGLDQSAESVKANDGEHVVGLVGRGSDVALRERRVLLRFVQAGGSLTNV